MELRVSRRYSLALYNASVKTQMLESVISDAYSVLDILNKSNRLKLFFTSPIISPRVKNKVVAEIFQKNIGKLTLEFIYLLIKHSRENVIHIIFEDFINLTK
jgi:F-type H+-transporting ATPase subunit delta